MVGAIWEGTMTMKIQMLPGHNSAAGYADSFAGDLRVLPHRRGWRLAIRGAGNVWQYSKPVSLRMALDLASQALPYIYA